MWLFTRYGFYSVACADGPDSKLDPDTVMVKARRRRHLHILQDRFPSLSSADIVTLKARDYRYRIIIPKELWVSVVVDLVREQDWSNFKKEAARYQGAKGVDYVDSLHDVWSVVYGLQETEPATERETKK